MKYIILTLLIASSRISIAQDIIYKKDGSTIEAEILNYNTKKITYKIWKYPKAPEQNININDVKFIKYKNGTIKNSDWFNELFDLNYSSFVDSRDGIIYKTIKLGNQIWMAENLKATKTTEGDDIRWVISDEDWANMNSTDLGYCYYNNDPSLGKIYGVLYNWYTAKKVCPSGWHLPSDAEWIIFTNNIAKYFYIDIKADDYGNINKVGGLLKEKGTLHWKSTNKEATNRIDFSALPGGRRNSNGRFYYLEEIGSWWTNTNDSSNKAYYRYIDYLFSGIYRHKNDVSQAYSVRCIKD